MRRRRRGDCLQVIAAFQQADDTAAAMPVAIVLPQQSIWWLAIAQSLASWQLREKVGNTLSSPLHVRRRSPVSEASGALGLASGADVPLPVPPVHAIQVTSTATSTTTMTQSTPTMSLSRLNMRSSLAKAKPENPPGKGGNHVRPHLVSSKSACLCARVGLVFGASR